MKKFNLGKIFCLTVGLSLAATSYADGLRLGVGALAGATGVDVSSNSPAESANMVENRKFGYGAGALIEVPIVEFFGLETGALYLHRRYDISNNSVNITRTVPSLIVPIEGRFWIGDIFTAAVGGFASIGVGKAKDEVNSGNVTVSNSFSHNDRKVAEFGLTAALGVNVPVWDKSGLFVEARYNHGLSDSSESATFEERIRDVIFMAGVRFDLDSDNHPSSTD